MKKFEVFENGGYRYTDEHSRGGCNIPEGVEPIEVYEGIEADKQSWLHGFKTHLEATQQAIVRAVVPEVFTMLDEGKSVKDPTRVHRIAMSRLGKSHFTKTCSRCGGTGKHSYNYKDGSVCYGCEGYGKKLPTITSKLLQEMTEFYKQT